MIVERALNEASQGKQIDVTTGRPLLSAPRCAKSWPVRKKKRALCILRLYSTYETPWRACVCPCVPYEEVGSNSVVPHSAQGKRPRPLEKRRPGSSAAKGGFRRWPSFARRPAFHILLGFRDFFLVGHLISCAHVKRRESEHLGKRSLSATRTNTRSIQHRWPHSSGYSIFFLLYIRASMTLSQDLSLLGRRSRAQVFPLAFPSQGPEKPEGSPSLHSAKAVRIRHCLQP